MTRQKHDEELLNIDSDLLNKAFEFVDLAQWWYPHHDMTNKEKNQEIMILLDIIGHFNNDPHKAAKAYKATSDVALRAMLNKFHELYSPDPSKDDENEIKSVEAYRAVIQEEFLSKFNIQLKGTRH